MFGEVRQLFTEDDNETFDDLYAQIEQEEDLSDQMELEIAHFLEQVSNDHLSDVTKMKIRQMMREIGELESIGDACYNLARTVNRRRQSGLRLSDVQDSQLADMMTLCEKAIEQMRFTMHGHRRQHTIDETYHLENGINQMRNRLKTDNIRAVNEHEHDYATGAIFSDMVGELEKLGDYVVNVVEARLGKNAIGVV